MTHNSIDKMLDEMAISLFNEEAAYNNFPVYKEFYKRMSKAAAIAMLENWPYFQKHDPKYHLPLTRDYDRDDLLTQLKEKRG